jgi:hypothetical protein
MTENFLFLGLIALAGVLTYFARYTPQILVRMACSITWLALGVWLFFGGGGLGISENWTKILVFVFVIMTVVPLTWQMRTDISRSVTKSNKNGSEAASWVEWTKPPTKQETSEDRQRAYASLLSQIAERARMRRRRR